MKKIFLILFLAAVAAIPANAATKTWDGGGANNNWTTAANWANDVAPVAGDDLIFPSGAAQLTTNNNFFFFTTFNSIAFTGGDAYSISGNPFSLNAGLTAESSLTITTAIRLNAAQTFRATSAAAIVSVLAVTNNGFLLTLDGTGQFGIGNLSGAGGLTKTGVGAALLPAANSYTGLTSVENGFLIVDGNQPNSQVSVTGGAVGGTGTIGATTVSTGAISAGTLTSPTGVLNVNGSLIIKGGTSAVVIKIGGNAPGANGYDQINVTGSINLNGSRFVPVPLNNFIPAIGETLTIIRNDGSDQITGTFANIAENALFVTPNNVAFRVSYQGGDGNDLTIRRVAYAKFDFDGDGKSDEAVFRPSQSNWYLNRSQNGFTAFQFGVSTDKTAAADFDGDGKTDVAVFRPSNGTWYFIDSSTNAFRAVQFGIAEDLPNSADFDGDGRADLAVFRPSNGTWYELRSANNSFFSEQFGVTGDLPVAADYDSDTRADLAVFRPSNGTWFYRSSLTGTFNSAQFGQSGDRPTPGDFDNDGVADFAVYRAGTNGNPSIFYILRSSDDSFLPIAWGVEGDLPTLADYDGDGKIDISVWRPANGIWYTILSANNQFRGVQFGVNGDKPIQTPN